MFAIIMKLRNILQLNVWFIHNNTRKHLQTIALISGIIHYVCMTYEISIHFHHTSNKFYFNDIKGT